MAKCDDCWCEHYEKNRGNCENCLKKNNTAEDKVSALNDMLNRRAYRQMEIDKPNKLHGQDR